MIRIIPYNLEPITINFLRILFDSSNEFCLCSASLSSYESNACPLIVMLAGLKAIEEYKCLYERFPHAKFIVLLSDASDLLPLNSIQSTPLAGAFYVEELNKGFVYILHAVAWGATVFSYKVVTQATTRANNELMLAMAHPELTSRDKDILSLIVAGNDNTQIACCLNLNEQTIRNYVSRLYEKFNVKNRTQLLAQLNQHGCLNTNVLQMSTN